MTATARLLQHCRSAVTSDGTFPLGFREIAITLAVTPKSARQAITDLIVGGAIIVAEHGKGHGVDTYRLTEAAPPPPQPDRRQGLVERLTAHCERLAAGTSDGRFELGKVGAAEALDTNSVEADQVLKRLANSGRIVRVRLGAAKRLPMWAMAGSVAAEAGPVSDPPAAGTVRCPTCGFAYVPDGPVSCCPRTLKWPHVTRRATR